MALQRPVKVTAQHLAVEEADGDLSGRSLGGKLLVARELDPLHGRERDPGGLVVLQATGIVNLHEEVRLVEVEIASHPLQRLVVEAADDYLSQEALTVVPLISPLACASPASSEARPCALGGLWLGAVRCDGRISCKPRCAC